MGQKTPQGEKETEAEPPKRGEKVLSPSSEGLFLTECPSWHERNAPGLTWSMFMGSGGRTFTSTLSALLSPPCVQHRGAREVGGGIGGCHITKVAEARQRQRAMENQGVGERWGGQSRQMQG